LALVPVTVRPLAVMLAEVVGWEGVVGRIGAAEAQPADGEDLAVPTVDW